MSFGKKIRFENSLAKKLYIEISGIRDMQDINKSYISLEYIWEEWQKAYKEDYGCTRYILTDLFEG